MSPEPIINIQTRLAFVGSIHGGGEKSERAPGKKLEAWRLTSPQRSLLEQAAQLYGGDVSPWRSPVGDEFQVYTEAQTLPVLVMPDYSLRRTWELWEGVTKRLRVCDGFEEQLSGQPCICNAEGVDRCSICTRLVVALPELDTVLGWRLISRGIYAAAEIPTTIALAQRIAPGASFVPMQLRLDNRRQVKDGQVVRFVVPTLDLGRGYLSIATQVNGPVALLPPGSTVPAASTGPAVVDLALSTTQAPVTPEGRSIAEFGDDVDEDFDEGPEAPPPDDPAAFGNSYAGAEGEDAQTKVATDAQRKKLNVLVGGLRSQGYLKTESVYDAIAGLRGTSGLDLLLTTDGGLDDEKVAHWGPLRDTLTRPEAMQLIDWLEEKERRVEAGEAKKVAP